MRVFIPFIGVQVAYERSVKDSDILNTRYQKLQQDFEAQLIACDQLNNENQTKAAELKVSFMRSFFCLLNCLIVQQKEEDVGSLKVETQRLNKMRETIQRKLRAVEDGKADTEQQRETLKGQIGGLERGGLLNWVILINQDSTDRAGVQQKTERAG